MSRYVHVSVTQEDIDKGIPSDATACPIARALRRHFGPDDRHIDVEVDSVIWVSDNNGVDMIATATNDVEDFVERFDNGIPVEPTEFDLMFEDARPAVCLDHGSACPDTIR